MSRAQAKKQTREPEVINELRLDDMDALRLVCGERDGNLRAVESRFGVTLHPRGNQIRVIGARAAANAAQTLLEDLYTRALAGKPIRIETGLPVRREDTLEAAHADADFEQRDVVLVTYKNIKLGPKTAGQRRYLAALDNNAVVFTIGPAGSGKTYLAVLVAVQKLLSREINRIILTRPAVEAGERLGFLPGDLSEKVNPYLRPLYDALHDMLPLERVQQMLASGEIEVAPLAFMRGRTLNNAFIILDEAQNTTSEQMKMFLTRIGKNSVAVVTGDVTQTDLPGSKQSGLVDAVRILEGVPDIGVVRLDPSDIVRHRIVQAIIDAYEADHARNPKLPLATEDA